MLDRLATIPLHCEFSPKLSDRNLARLEIKDEQNRTDLRLVLDAELEQRRNEMANMIAFDHIPPPRPVVRFGLVDTGENMKMSQNV
jgi:hypothetical protein